MSFFLSLLVFYFEERDQLSISNSITTFVSTFHPKVPIINYFSTLFVSLLNLVTFLFAIKE